MVPENIPGSMNAIAKIGFLKSQKSCSCPKCSGNVQKILHIAECITIANFFFQKNPMEEKKDFSPSATHGNP
jgi:hypothetical protein